MAVERPPDFASTASPVNLVGAKAGHKTAQWRDSDDGLGGGRYAYDVNVVFVPAALGAVDRLLQSGLLDPYLSSSQRRVLMQAQAQSQIWSRQASALFAVTVAASRARIDISAYATAVGVESEGPLASFANAPLVFNALSFNEYGQPVPIMHSDDGFALLFGLPTPAERERSIAALMRPFFRRLWTQSGCGSPTRLSRIPRCSD